MSDTNGVYYENLKLTSSELQNQLIKDGTQNEVDLNKLKQLLRSDYGFESNNDNKV